MRVCISCAKVFDHESPQCPFCLFEPKRVNGHLAFAPELAAESSGFEPRYFGPLAEVEAGNFWFRSRNQLLIWALQRYFPEAGNFLEIGCGTGYVLSGIRKALPELTVCGSEVFSSGLSFAAERLPGIELFQMDARRIPFREEFDVVGAFDVLEHVEEDEEVLSQMYQATRKRGGILVTVPHHPFLWSQADEYARHLRRYKTQELKDKVKRAGFDHVRVTSFVSVLLPLLIISRFKQRLTREDFDPMSEFRIGSLVNAALERILDGERAMVRTGFSFPFGGSLLLVARRN
jgi:SAM-dependent methyltransferase